VNSSHVLKNVLVKVNQHSSFKVLQFVRISLEIVAI